MRQTALIAGLTFFNARRQTATDGGVMLVKRIGTAVVAIAIGLLLLHEAQAETVAQEWVIASDWSRMTVNSTGNVYAIGSKIEKFNAQGVNVWSHNSTSPCGAPCGYKSISSIAVNPSGTRIWIVGGAGSSYGDSDMFVQEYDSSGVYLWTRTYGTSSSENEIAHAVAVDSADNVYVTGTTHSGSRNATTFSYDPAGTLRWGPATYNNGSHDDGNDIGVDSSGRTYVMAMSIGNAEDYLLIIYDSSGNQQCTDRYNGPGGSPNSPNDVPSAMAVYPSGGAVVTGSSMGSSQNTDIYSIKYNTGCGRDWEYRYDSGFGEGGSDVAIDPSGSVWIVGGASEGPGPYNRHIITQRYNSGGGAPTCSVRNDPVQNNDGSWPSHIAADSAGAYVAGMLFDPSPADTGDWATIAYTSSCSQRWLKQYPVPVQLGQGVDYPRDIVSSPAGGIYVLGHVDGSPSEAIVKYCGDTVNTDAANAGLNRPGSDDLGDACDVDDDGDGYTETQEAAVVPAKSDLLYCRIMRADVDGDGTVTILDLSQVAGWYGQNVPPAPDLLRQDADLGITILDLSRQASVYLQNVSACP